MEIIKIKVPAVADIQKIEELFLTALATSGLQVVLRGTLKKFPGSLHWHAKNPGHAGTLELTYWPQRHHAWFSIQGGRTADWIAIKLPQVQRALLVGD